MKITVIALPLYLLSFSSITYGADAKLIVAQDRMALIQCEVQSIEEGFNLIDSGAMPMVVTVEALVKKTKVTFAGKEHGSYQTHVDFKAIRYDGREEQIEMGGGSILDLKKRYWISRNEKWRLDVSKALEAGQDLTSDGVLYEYYQEPWSIGGTWSAFMSIFNFSRVRYPPPQVKYTLSCTVTGDYLDLTRPSLMSDSILKDWTPVYLGVGSLEDSSTWTGLAKDILVSPRRARASDRRGFCIDAINKEHPGYSYLGAEGANRKTGEHSLHFRCYGEK